MTESPTAAAVLSPFDVVIFDLDGVVTDTASVHEAAWRDLFNEVLKDVRLPPVARKDPFATTDYQRYVVGRPREDGVEAFLGSRAIELPAGDVMDRPGEWSVHGLAGVEAAHKRGFGLVVGIDRADARRSELEAAGADIVLNDVGELDLGRVLTDPWRLVYEALTTLSNGYLAVRGAAPESRMSEVRYPSTYLAGVYNRLVSTVQGQATEDEHMVNVPNWLVLDVRLDETGWWSRGGLKIRRERRVLDLFRATLRREIVLEADDGSRLELVQRRFVSMAQPHLMALETTFTARGWSGSVGIRSGVDTSVANENVPEDALLTHHHLLVLKSSKPAEPIPVIEVETSQSHMRIATERTNMIPTAQRHLAAPPTAPQLP